MLLRIAGNMFAIFHKYSSWALLSIECCFFQRVPPTWEQIWSHLKQPEQEEEE